MRTLLIIHLWLLAIFCGGLMAGVGFSSGVQLALKNLGIETICIIDKLERRTSE